MKAIAKIFLGTSLIALAACSGKGEGGSRIHDLYEENNQHEPATDPSEINEEEGPAGPAGDKIACSDKEGFFCIETTDKSLKPQCAPMGGQIVDKCPAGGTKCSFAGMPAGTDFFAYNASCSDLETLLYGDDWED